MAVIFYYFNPNFMNTTIIKKPYHFKNYTTEYEECNFKANAEFTVLYIHGLRSNPWSRKADNIKETSHKLGLNFRRYELIGHGSDTENFTECDFDLWKEQLRDIIENHLKGPLVIVGHCVGAWLGMCITEEYPDRIKAFLSLAASPDLIEQLLTRSTHEQRQALAETGVVEANIEKYHYVFSQRLWTSLHANDLLQKPVINITCPIHLLHGQQDNFIDWHVVLKLVDKVAYPKAVVKLLKNSNHHLQDAVAIQETKQSLCDLYALIKKKEA